MANFVALVEQNRPQIEALLPNYMTPARFFALVQQIEKDPKLKECTPESLLECVLHAAQCGFEIGGPDQHCYLIPYGKQAQLQASWRGMVYRLVQAHAASHIFADLVYQGDIFEPSSGTKRELRHIPARPRSKVIEAAYAVAILPNGVTDFEILEPADIEAIEKAALRISGGKPSPAWQFFRGEMIKKSAIKRLGKRLQGDRRAAPDELDRLRATMELRSDIDLDRVKQAEQANSDLPDPREKGRKVEAEVVDSTSKDDPTIDDAEQDRLNKAWKTAGRKPSELSTVLFEQFGCIRDLEELRVSQVPQFERLVGAGEMKLFVWTSVFNNYTNGMALL